MSYSTRGSLHVARDVDAMVAAEWSLEDLRVERLYAEMGPESGRVAEEEIGLNEQAEERREQERMVQEAYARGLEEGRREGEASEAARLRNALRAVEVTLGELRENEERWTSNIEENICALAVAIARQIVDQELQSDPALIANLVGRALDEFPIEQSVRIRIHPRDQAVIESRSAGSRLPTSIQGREATWLPDANLMPGGCLVEGRDRIIDGRIDTALERVYRRLTYVSV